MARTPVLVNSSRGPRQRILLRGRLTPTQIAAIPDWRQFGHRWLGNFNASHTYSDNLPKLTPYTATVTITDASAVGLERGLYHCSEPQSNGRRGLRLDE